MGLLMTLQFKNKNLYIFIIFKNQTLDPQANFKTCKHPDWDMLKYSVCYRFTIPEVLIKNFNIFPAQEFIKHHGIQLLQFPKN